MWNSGEKMNKITAINYADEKFRNAQKLNTKTALLHGADIVIEYTEKDIDSVFYQRNKEILTQKRGNGYWLWKPYIIQKSLEKMNEGEYLVYSDSGSCYINEIEQLIENMQSEKVEIMIFSLPNQYLEKFWSKRDAFILMDCDTEEYFNTSQRLAGFLVMRKSDAVCQFISQWLKWAQDSRIITDQENKMGRENYSGFRDNRHDQTILSLLSKKYKLPAFRNPSCVVSDNNTDVLERSKYPQIFDLHRMPDVCTVEEIWKIRTERAESLLKYWSEGEKILLYGAGKYAKRVLAYIQCKGLSVAACIVSDEQVIDESMLFGVKIFHISEIRYQKEHTVILSTINFPEVIEALEKSGYFYKIIDGAVLAAITALV